MARSRNIKPGFFKNEELAECTPMARLLFAGLWTLADREGRVENRSRKIQAEIFPYESCDCTVLIEELRGHGFIMTYEVEGLSYIWIPSFLKHQNPHIKEAPSKLPPYPGKNGSSPVLSDASPEKASTSPADSLISESLNPDSLTPSTKGCVCVPDKPDLRQKQFEQVLAEFPLGKDGRHLGTEQARGAFFLLPEHQVADFLQAVKHYAASDRTSRGFVMGIGRFAEKDWRDWIAPPRAPPEKPDTPAKSILPKNWHDKGRK